MSRDDVRRKAEEYRIDFDEVSRPVLGRAEPEHAQAIDEALSRCP